MDRFVQTVAAIVVLLGIGTCIARTPVAGDPIPLLVDVVEQP